MYYNDAHRRVEIPSDKRPHSFTPSLTHSPRVTITRIASASPLHSLCSWQPEKLEYFCESQPFPKTKLRDLKRRALARYKESVELKGRAANGAKLPFVECYKEYVQPGEFAEHLFEQLQATIKKDFAGQRKSTGAPERGDEGGEARRGAPRGG